MPTGYRVLGWVVVVVSFAMTAFNLWLAYEYQDPMFLALALMTGAPPCHTIHLLRNS